MINPPMTPRALSTWILLSSFIGAGSHAADDDRISSDRPDFLTSPEAVGKGRVQLEFGPLVQRADAGDTRTRTVATPMLVRLGLTDALELRLETDGRLRTRDTDLPSQTTVYTRGYADASVGIKWKTHEGDPGKGAPSMGWLFTA